MLSSRYHPLFMCLIAMLPSWTTAPAAEAVAGPGAGQEYSGVDISASYQSAVSTSSRPLTATITVDKKRIIGPLEKKLFGFNTDRYALETTLLLPGTQQIDPEASHLLHGIPLPLVRSGGSEAMQFRWKRAIGPNAERQPQKLWPWATSEKLALGAVEMEQWLRSIDPKTETAWVLNLFQDTPEDHADLAEFLTGTPGKPRGSIDWAQKRVALGLKEPVKVAIWELGNEVDWDSTHKLTIEQYIDACRKTIQAIRQVDPKAKFAVHALTAPWSPNHQEFSGSSWSGWHRNLLRKLGPEIDYISFHPYYDGNPLCVIERYLDRIRDDIQDITKDNRIRVYISEHARWPETPKKGEWKDNWFQTHSLDGCLSTAQFLVRCLSRPEITAASYHALTTGPWGLFFCDPESGKLYTSGMAELFRFFSKLPDGNVVATTISGSGTDPNRPDLEFIAATVSTPQGLFLVVVNRGAERKAKLALGSNYQLRSGYKLTAPDRNSVNTLKERTISITSLPSLSRDAVLNEILIPPLSVNLLELTEIK